MATKTINTRIVLRNDALSAWEKSTKALLKGEAALALREDGKYEIRIGTDGTKTWNDLSASGIVLSTANILGLSDFVAEHETNTTY